MNREIPAVTQQDIEQESSANVFLAFLTIENEALLEPIYIVSDVLDYVLNGQLYIGLPFGFKLISDSSERPETQLMVQNVDRRIGQALRSATSRASVRLEIYSSADFDLTVSPRTEISSAAIIYGFSNFDLVEVDVNNESITGRVLSVDLSSEPWPQERATQDRCPGLFR